MMQKTGFLLKVSFLLVTGVFFSMSVSAQEANGKVKQNSTGVQSVNPKSARGYQASSEVKQPSVKAVDRTGSPARKCTPAVRQNPYSIKRSVFNKLPANRQAFVLSHPEKYTIID